MSYIIGLTGQSGAGKTTISEVWRQHGFGAIDCDRLAHSVMNGADCLNALTAAFSKDILDKDGNLDRKALGRIVFSDAESLKLLNATSHPFIMSELKKMIEEMSSKYSVIMVDAPTLFESGADKLCQKTVGIIADREILLKRICQRDSISLEEGKKRLDSQRDAAFFSSRCDIIIENSGDIRALEAKAAEVAEEVKGFLPQ